MIQIFWPTFSAGLIIFVISYLRMRNKIPSSKRDNIEKILMLIAVILLSIDITFIILERKNASEDLNICIEHYRYLPDSSYEKMDLFCSELFSDTEIELLRKSGRDYSKKEIGGGNYLNISIPK